MKELLERAFSFLHRGGNEDAFAARESVSLEHHWQTCARDRAPGGGLSVDYVRASGWNPVSLEERLAPGLAPFQPCRLTRWAEHAQAPCNKAVDNARRERRLWSNDRQIDALTLRQLSNALDVRGLNRDCAWRAAVTWCDEHCRPVEL